MSNSEILTDFRKTVETSMDPGFLQNIIYPVEFILKAFVSELLFSKVPLRSE